MKYKEPYLDTVKGVVSIIASVVWVAMIPLYGSPFGGCEATGFLTFNSGCSSWPEFLRGFGFVFVLFIMNKKYITVPAFGFVIIAVISFLGGTELIRQGEVYQFDSLERLYYSIIGGFPLILGGLSAFGLGVYMKNVKNNRQIKNA